MKASDPQHWHKVLVLPLGVDPNAFAPRAQTATVAGERFKMVFVGSLAPPKGLQVLIAAVELLAQRGRAVELTIVGEGPARAGLEALVQQKRLEKSVLMPGACNHDKVADYYRRSDAFVLASFAEGVPVVLMEAMAMELPCVSTRITGIPELIDDGVNGLLVPPASAVALADAVERLIADPALARRIGLAGREKVLTKYQLTKNSELLAAVFKRLAS
jgi:glycosyltransferase involved in cell wall biosynthesis